MLSSSATPKSLSTYRSSLTSNPTTLQIPIQQTQLHLEQILLELRQQIYRNLFSKYDATVLSVAVRLHHHRGTQALQSPVFPAVHNLFLMSHQISDEARAYFFAFYRFCFVSIYGEQGYLPLTTSFWQRIGAHNLSLIRKLALSSYSIGLFGKVDCAMGQSKLWFASRVLAKFTGLTHLDLDVSVVECLSPAHSIFSDKSPTAKEVEEMELWDRTNVEVTVFILECVREVGRVIGGKEVQVGVYWSDLLTQELLLPHNQYVFRGLESIYEKRLLVVL